ncbi:hypothetical protein Nepgr_012352 [Nepenthes gracilis]|uniref:Uncharacterized protein n=1 Tax=Nepenthes gracilis TaxID=150966 RepID=A0AAD3SHD1_NEPGR|nr:hypothetical protein Nepgr_012352 [Nepenthes gracilis]
MQKSLPMEWISMAFYSRGPPWPSLCDEVRCPSSVRIVTLSSIGVTTILGYNGQERGFPSFYGDTVCDDHETSSEDRVLICEPSFRDVLYEKKKGGLCGKMYELSTSKSRVQEATGFLQPILTPS